MITDVITQVINAINNNFIPKAINYKKNRSYSSSIKKRTQDLILQYPMLFSNTLNAKTAELLSRALEHEYANLMVIALQNEIFNMVDSDVTNVKDYLKRYHSNVKNDNVLDQASEYLNNWFESVNEKDLIRANKELMTLVEDTYNTTSLNKLSFPNSILKESDEKPVSNEKPVSDTTTTGKTGIKKDECKKLNNLTPTIINMNMTFTDKETKNTITREVTFGIKGVIHPLLSNDVVYYLSDTVKNKSLFFKLIRYTTGELKFFKDIILSADTTKKRAKDSASKYSFWWNKLKELSTDSKFKTLFKGRNSNAPIPTSTLIISKNDIDEINYKHGIDLLTNTNEIKKIMDDFFLLNFIVIDEATEMAYLYNETTRDYAIQTFNGLRQTAEQKDFTDNNPTKSLFR